MPVHNADIATIFEEIADLLEIENANPFRIRAYRNAARIVLNLSEELSILVKQGEDPARLPGIGSSLAEKIVEIVETGRCQALEKLRRQGSPGLTELLHIPGLGPKRVAALYHELDIHNTEQLFRAAKDGRLQQLPGFGKKTEQHILEMIETHVKQAKRFKLGTAAQYADSLQQFMQQNSEVNEVVVAGSFRRCRETVGDLDILVTADKSAPVMDHFASYDEITEILSKGKTRSTVILKNGLQVDLRVVPVQSFGAALHYFTGSKAHNIAIRRRARQRGLKVNEYGVFKGNRIIAGDTEESVYQSVDLPYIPPELRENRGEIEAAEDGKLPRLITVEDIKGDLHAHTTATDGHNSIEEMADAARARGLAYIAITEHSRRLTVTHGLDEKRLLKQIEEIDKLNDRLKGITVLKGIEVDILEDGSLDLPDRVLARLDLVIGAVHSKFHLSRQKQTTRILRAMERPYFTMLAHPTGRLLERREPYDVDMWRVIDQARQRGCYLELNCHPERLDLLDTHCLLAKQAGVLVSINTDAHSIADLDNLRYGVGQARRGWLEAEDVLNTLPLKTLRQYLKATMT
ncbi:MAG: DNA polymerase/3'-5' exonuclease PolX [Gammaproteobacteria bacterium]|nr:DNA polymerase/3'-5' exonuclease PolX [Gammaproteobacteria bacterium]